MKVSGIGNLENSVAQELLRDVFGEIHKILALMLIDAAAFDADAAITYLDMLAFLSEHYQANPGIRIDIFEQLRQKIVEYGKTTAPERLVVIDTTLEKLETQIRRFSPE